MTDAVSDAAPQQVNVADRAARRLARRQAAERRFRLYGMLAVTTAVFFLALLFVSIISKAYPAFTQTEIALQLNLDAARLDPEGNRDPDVLIRGDYGGIVKQGLRDRFPDVEGRREKRDLYDLISPGAAYELRNMVLANPDLVGREVTIWLPASDDADIFVKGFIDRDLDPSQRHINDRQIAWLDQLAAEDAVETRFNWRFFVNGDSREPEMAGIWGAVVGSFYTLLVTLLLAFPIGVMSSIYLEEFAPKNRWTEIIEVNINNLAAVPSIVFGLLGLAVFLNFFGLPRSAPLVGGMVLALMTLPTIIIAGRAALKAVPPSIREAALGMGASRVQVVTHHVLPLAMPGVLTGTIIGMAQALGETAPLLMIGMVAFIADVPGGPTDAATVLPVQIYLWADSPERAFVARTSAAILVLLGFLVTMNLLAVILRRRFERKW